MAQPSADNCRPAAFFDLERTITPHAVEQELALSLFKRGELGVGDLGRVLWAYSKYNLGLISNFEQLKAQGARVFQGRQLAPVLKFWHRLYDERMSACIFPAARERIRQFQRAGHPVFIISSTYEFLVEPYAQELEVDGYFGARLELRAGVCTGRLEGPLYHQESKASQVRTLAEEYGLSLEHSYAFGDSVNDRQMLGCVGHGVVVNPGRKMKAIANRQGWQSAQWCAI